jgi:hypothetical protein
MPTAASQLPNIIASQYARIRGKHLKIKLVIRKSTYKYVTGNEDNEWE